MDLLLGNTPRVIWWRHLVAFLPLLLVACEPEKPKSDPIPPIQRKLSELEDLIANQRLHTLQVLQEHEQKLDEQEGKIRQIVQIESGLEDKLKSLESDLGSVNSNSRGAKSKFEDLEMDVSSLKMGVSDLEMEISRLKMGMRSL